MSLPLLGSCCPPGFLLMGTPSLGHFCALKIPVWSHCVLPYHLLLSRKDNNQSSEWEAASRLFGASTRFPQEEKLPRGLLLLFFLGSRSTQTPDKQFSNGLSLRKTTNQPAVISRVKSGYVSSWPLLTGPWAVSSISKLQCHHPSKERNAYLIALFGRLKETCM